MKTSTLKIMAVGSSLSLLIGLYTAPAFAQRQETRQPDCRRTLAFTPLPGDKVAAVVAQQDDNRDQNDPNRRAAPQKQKRPCLRLASL